MNTQDTIAILVNPKSNPAKSKKILEAIDKTLKQEQRPYSIFIHEWPENINLFRELWIVGGDGTINYLLNHYMLISIPIAVLKAGTGNDIAWKLYGNLVIEEQIHRILKSSPQLIDAGVCNGRIFINGVGIGFDGEVLRSINAIRKIGGHAGYLMVVLKKIFSFKEQAFTIYTANKTIKEKFLLVMVTNSSRTGGGFMVSPEASMTDGKFNLILCKPLSILNRLLNLPVIEKGKHLDKNYIIHQLVSDVLIVGEKPLYAQLDGELIEGHSFKITVLHKRYYFKY